jgi:hypothetical protein
MKKLLLALLTATTFALPIAAYADVILTFGQAINGDTITATDDGTTTDIEGLNIPVTVTQILGPVVTPFLALLDLSAVSTGPVQSGPLGVIEPFSGNFTITSPLCGIGFNCLSGTFTGATFGFLDGASLTMASAQPPGSLIFTSDVITELNLPRGMAFSFANVTPPVHVDGTTIGAFTSSVSGTFSAAVVPEPASVLLFGVALLALAFVRRRT